MSDNKPALPFPQAAFEAIVAFGQEQLKFRFLLEALLTRHANFEAEVTGCSPQQVVDEVRADAARALKAHLIETEDTNPRLAALLDAREI